MTADFRKLTGLKFETFSYLTHISKNKKWIYLEVPKTACTVVKQELLSLSGHESGNTTHLGVHELAFKYFDRPIQESVFDLNNIFTDEYFKFAFVRNPLIRLLSCYLDKFVNNQWERERLKKLFNISLDKEFTFKEFLLFVRSQPVEEMDIHWLPQSKIINENIHLDYIGRFENFANDLNHILGVIHPGKTDTFFPLTNHVTNASKHLKNFYKNEEFNLALAICEEDFVRFDYSPEIY